MRTFWPSTQTGGLGSMCIKKCAMSRTVENGAYETYEITHNQIVQWLHCTFLLCTDLEHYPTYALNCCRLAYKSDLGQWFPLFQGSLYVVIIQYLEERSAPLYLGGTALEHRHPHYMCRLNLCWDALQMLGLSTGPSCSCSTCPRT